ncbi:hypothetical protein EDB87DRAFT_1631686 [Lactarius vividus]|nr:hypothetical protein EDB87DRAFT_1631686 [Lactarius vividus]
MPTLIIRRRSQRNRLSGPSRSCPFASSSRRTRTASMIASCRICTSHSSRQSSSQWTRMSSENPTGSRSTCKWTTTTCSTTSEEFSPRLYLDLGLSGEAEPLIVHAVHEELMKHMKDAIEWRIPDGASGDCR